MSNILYISMGSNFKWRQVHPKNLRGAQCAKGATKNVSVRVTGALGNDSHAESGHGLERRKSAKASKASKACENELQMKARGFVQLTTSNPGIAAGRLGSKTTMMAKNIESTKSIISA